MVGAVVGVQPFGGQGLSGTGPKAGGPLYPRRLLAQGPAYLPAMAELPGPVGEQNLYKLRNRGRVLCIAKTGLGRQAQAEAVFASGASASHDAAAPFSAVLLEGDTADTLQLQQKLAERPGAIILLQALSTAALAQGAVYNPAWLVHERVTSTNTAAAGGNTALVAKI
jgi:RHH-type proline utilization regulon transcriptional repressor/proline dehydrogenase/delta 1-pyrroline-5-carboxylate dehydrogenase